MRVVHSPCGHGVDYRQVVRQQIDIATKALSPTVNDRYTAVQVIDHLTVVCSDPAVRKLGADIRKALQDAAASSSQAPPYEAQHGNRLPVVQAMRSRLTELSHGAGPSGGSPTG